MTTPVVPVPSRRIVLDPDEEVVLAARIEAGALAAAVLRGEWALAHQGSEVDEDELRVLTRLGADAFTRFVEANLALIGLVLRQEFGHRSAEADLFQEGCLGLIEAVRRFDHRRGCRFATYALYWIRAYLRAAGSRRDDLSGLSGEASAQLRRARGIGTRLSQQLGREPTVHELAAALGRSAGWTGQLLARRPDVQLTELGAAQLADTRAERAVEAVLDGAMPGEELLLGLEPLTRRVLRLRYGFDQAPGPAPSVAQIARLLGLTVRQVRRLEQDGLDELRSTCPQHARIHLAG